MASLFEDMVGTYTLGTDGMYYSNLELPEEETPLYSKHGKMLHTYLREHKKHSTPHRCSMASWWPI